MTSLASGESGWAELTTLFGVGVLTGLSPWLFALKGLPWFPKLPPTTSSQGEGTARLLFTATASICSAWVYMIFASLPPIHFMVMYRGLVSLSTSFVSLLAYVTLWLWLSAIEARIAPVTPPATALSGAWGKKHSAVFLAAFGLYVLTFASLAISVSVATAFQENYLVEGQVLDARKKPNEAPQAVTDVIVKAQAMDGIELDETETNKKGKFLLVVPRKGMQVRQIKVIATLQTNQVPTNDIKRTRVLLRGWNKMRIVFHAGADETEDTAVTPTPTPSSTLETAVTPTPSPSSMLEPIT